MKKFVIIYKNGIKKCRCECLKIRGCEIGYSWNINNCRCEMKKLAALIETEECNVETDKIVECKKFPKNKTITLIKKMQNCRPFISVSILFLCFSIALIGIMVYFCLRLKNNVLPYQKKFLFLVYM